jgi:hypothetical protein
MVEQQQGRMVMKSRAVREPNPRLIAEALRDDLESLERDVDTLSITDGVALRLRLALRDAAASAHDIAVQLHDRQDAFLRSFRSEVRQQPAAACAISILVGVIFAAAVFRR